MQISLEPYSEELVAELHDLFSMHCDEISVFGEKVSPDLKVYGALAENNAINIFVAREKGMAIGYIIFFLSNHLHYKNMRVASQDLLYLHPDYRKGMTGLKLIKEAEATLDVDCILQNTKSSRDLGPLFERLGYEKMETIYMRKL